ncbi:hypothetical protein [Gordonia paraffinivorans]|uniref:hypothetical protein n=1 Tax=Gordonia paraffinivorans TaxID=175628 RepID=UPI001C93130F|nr:hypothetical protein [Gordonia paraffinivorans]
MLRALGECVLPELPPGSAAAEQTALVMGHLGVLKDQVDFAAAFDAYEMSCAEALSTALIDEFDGIGDHASAAVDSLRENLTAGSGAKAPAAMRRRTDELGGLVEALIRAAGIDGSPEFRSRAGTRVLEYERPRMSANRALFRGMNWETNVTGLPELEVMLFDR